MITVSRLYRYKHFRT